MDDLRWLLPHGGDPVQEELAAHQLAYDFYDEVQYRHDFEQYCAWYDAVAAANRQELHKMQTDFNFLGWFYRGG